MGTTTSGRFKFYKPDGFEFVDPSIDMLDNLNIMDNAVYNLIRYRINTSGILPNGNSLKVGGAKLYDYYTGTLEYLDTSDGVNYQWNNITKVNNNSLWIKFTLLTQYTTAAFGPDMASYRYTDTSNTHVELRGKVWAKTGGLVNNANTPLTDLGAVPSPAWERAFSMVPGISSANVAVNTTASRVSVLSGGQINYGHYGTNNSTTDNYICLDNIIYAL